MTWWSFHVKNSYKNRTTSLLQEVRGIWTDLLITVLCDEWKKCKRGTLFIIVLLISTFFVGSNDGKQI